MSELIRPARKGARWIVPTDQPYVVCRVASGHDWWDTDDAVAAIPGRRHVTSRSRYLWHAIPLARLDDLEAIAERNPGSLVVHNV